MNPKIITLTELRDLSAELGMELFYLKEGSKTEQDKVNYDNFDLKRKMGLSKDGEISIKPITLNLLVPKMVRAVTRKKKAAHIKKTQEQYGVTE